MILKEFLLKYFKDHYNEFMFNEHGEKKVVAYHTIKNPNRIEEKDRWFALVMIEDGQIFHAGFDKIERLERLRILQTGKVLDEVRLLKEIKNAIEETV